MTPGNLVHRRWPTLVSLWVLSCFALSGAQEGTTAIPTRVLATHQLRVASPGTAPLASPPAPAAATATNASTAKHPTPSRARVSRGTTRRCLDSGSGWVERRGQLALARLHLAWRSLGYRVQFHPAREGYLGMAYPSQRRIEIYVRSCANQSDTLLAVTVAHELGHAFDARYGTPERRAAWLRLRGAPNAPWFPPRGAQSDYECGAGDFAEVFAMWLVSGRYFASRLAPRPTPAQLSRLAPLLRP